MSKQYYCMDDFINFGWSNEDKKTWDSLNCPSCMTPEDECETFCVKQDFDKLYKENKKGDAIK